MNKAKKSSKVCLNVNESVSDVYGYYLSSDELDYALKAAKGIYGCLKKHSEALEEENIESACRWFEKLEEKMSQLSDVIEDAKYE